MQGGRKSWTMPNASNFGFKIACFHLGQKCTFAIVHKCTLASRSHVFIWAKNALLQFCAHWDLNRSCTVLQTLLNNGSRARRRPLVAAVQLCKNAVLPGGQDCFSYYNGNTSNCERLVGVCFCLTPVPGRQRNLLYKNGTVVHLNDFFMLKLLQTSSKT